MSLWIWLPLPTSSLAMHFGSLRQLIVGSMYITETSKCYKSGLYLWSSRLSKSEEVPERILIMPMKVKSIISIVVTLWSAQKIWENILSVFENCSQFSISYGSDHQCFLHNLKHKILKIQNPLGYLKAEIKHLMRMLITCSWAPLRFAAVPFWLQAPLRLPKLWLTEFSSDTSTILDCFPFLLSVKFPPHQDYQSSSAS